MQFNVADVGVKVSAEQLVAFLNDQTRGGFCYIHEYVNGETGEIANHWFKGACIYPNMVKRSVEMIDSGVLTAKLIEEGLSVTRGVWVGPDGIKNTRKAKDRVYQVIKKVYSMDVPEDKVVIDTAIQSVLMGLVAPKTVDQGFSSIAKGTYVKEDEAPGVVYFRDCVAVNKFVVKQGTYEQKASEELSAVKEAIRKLLPVGKYRAYKLNNNFTYINIEGQSLLQGADISKWDMNIALKEDVKEAIQEAVMVPVVEAIVAKIEAEDEGE
jgi:hypothetical protein